MSSDDDTDLDMPSKFMNFPQDIPVNEAYRGDDGATSATLASTAFDFDFENGRTYHAYQRGMHIFPNDHANTQHEHVANLLFLRSLGDRLYVAPIESPTRVLDIGTGVGLWAFDMADRFPDAQIVGMDLNPVNPEEALPPNLEYMLEDVNRDWIGLDAFDFVHLRSMFGSKIEWREMYSQIFDNMKSGGYIQQMEIEIVPRTDDNSMPKDSIFIDLANYARHFKDGTGRDFNISEVMKTMIEDAGFVEVVEERVKLPVGHWPSDERFQELGAIMEKYLRTGIQGWLMRALTEYYSLKQKDVDKLCKKMFDALDRGREHIYYTLVVVYGRRP